MLIKEVGNGFKRNFISVFPAFLGIGTVLAGNPYIDIPYEQYKADEARRHWWSSLSEREKYLVNAIGKVENDYHTNSGQYISVNQANVAKVMSIIGANNSETNFVSNRMQFYIKMEQASKKADDLIDTILNDKRIWGN